jgi:dynein heavy chain
VKSSQSRYEIGLDKLAFTSQQVEVMRQELRALKPVLEKTVRNCTVLKPVLEKTV